MNGIINTPIKDIAETKISEFWWSRESFAAAYGEDFVAFPLFGKVHLTWLAIAVVLWVVGPVIYSKLGTKARRVCLLVIASLLIIWEIVSASIFIVTGQWDNDKLPLHFCTINIFVCLFYAFKPTPIVADFLYAACLPGALFALLTPSWQLQPMANFFHIHSEVLHIMLVLFPILLFVDGFRPNFRNLWKLFVVTVLFSIPMYFLNIALGTNFFFVNGDDGIGTFMLLGSIFPDYRIGLLFLIAVLWILLYLPWIIAEKLKKRNVQ